MAKDPDLVRKAPDKWSNLHGTAKVEVRERLTIFNRVKGKSTLAGMRDTAGRIQAIAADAVAKRSGYARSARAGPSPTSPRSRTAGRSRPRIST